jgi:hypothetical protein
MAPKIATKEPERHPLQEYRDWWPFGEYPAVAHVPWLSLLCIVARKRDRTEHEGSSRIALNFRQIATEIERLNRHIIILAVEDIAAVARRNVTIVHGDSHVWNIFLPRTGGNDDVRIFDWDC